jgi:hypothetical protein
MFRKHLPNMKFLNFIPQFVDLQDFYKKIYPENKNGISLAKVCEKIMKQKLCKSE